MPYSYWPFSSKKVRQEWHITGNYASKREQECVYHAHKKGKQISEPYSKLTWLQVTVINWTSLRHQYFVLDNQHKSDLIENWNNRWTIAGRIINSKRLPANKTASLPNRWPLMLQQPWWSLGGHRNILGFITTPILTLPTTQTEIKGHTTFKSKAQRQHQWQHTIYTHTSSCDW